MRIFMLLFVSSLLVSIQADEESVVQKEDVKLIVQEEAQVLNDLQVQSDRRWTEFGEEVTQFIANSEVADGDAGDNLYRKFVSMSQQDRQVKDQLNLKVKRELVETAKKGMQQIFGAPASMGPPGTVTCPEASSYCDGDGDCWEAQIPDSWCSCDEAQELCGSSDYDHYDYYGGYSDHDGGNHHSTFDYGHEDHYGGYSDHYGGYSDYDHYDYYGGYSDHYGGYSDYDHYDYYGGYSGYSGYDDHYSYYGDDEWWQEPTASWWEDLIAGGEDFGQYAIAIIRDLGHHACPEGYGTGDHGLDGICEEYFGYVNHYHHHRYYYV